MKTLLTISDRGVLTLPAKLRKELGLKGNDPLIAETTADGLLLRLAVALPLEIYTPAREREFDEEEQAVAKWLRTRMKDRNPESSDPT